MTDVALTSGADRRRRLSVMTRACSPTAMTTGTFAGIDGIEAGVPVIEGDGDGEAGRLGAVGPTVAGGWLPAAGAAWVATDRPNGDAEGSADGPAA